MSKNILRDMLNDTKRKAAKKALAKVKQIMLKVLAAILPLFIKILVVVISVIAIFVAIEYLVELITEDKALEAFYDELNVENLSELVEIKQDSNGGGYHLEFVNDIDTKLDEVIKKFNEEVNRSINTENKDSIKKFIRAEMASQFPDLIGESDGKTKFQGAVKVKRISPNKNIGDMQKASGISEKQLKYVTKEIFDNYVSSGNSEALNVFTLSEDNQNIITATWSYENNSLSIKENACINYREKIVQYTMPFEYPFIFYINSNNMKFCEGLADLSINSKIEIAVTDNINTYQITTVTSVSEYSSKGQEVSKNETTTTAVSETVSSNIEVLNIESWWAKLSNTVNIKTSDSSNTEQNQTSNVTLDNGNNQITVVQTKKDTIQNQIQRGQSEEEENTQGFVDLFNNNNLSKSIQPNWLFRLLERNDKTKDMVELTKYLLYKASGKDYGVTKVDFDWGKINSGNASSMEGNLSVFGQPDCTVDEFISAAKAYKPDNSQYQNNLAAYAKDFYEVCKKNNVNPKFAYAHACLETGYGGGYAADRYNYFGMAAYNDNPDSATSYSSPAESVQAYCNWVKRFASDQESNEVAARLSQYKQELVGTADSNIYVLYIRYAQLSAYHGGGEQGDPMRASNETKAFVCNHQVGTPTTDEEKAAYAVYTTNLRIEIMENIFGKSTGGSQAGNVAAGIQEKYTSSNGRTYTVYGQDIGPWANVPYVGTTISHAGCSITSVAIALSAYGVNITPDQVLAENPNFGVSGALQKRGVNCSYGNATKDKIIEHLQKKKTVIVHVVAPSDFTSSEHWMVLADVSNDGKLVYVCNPYSNNTNGWVSIHQIYTLEDCLYLE